MPQTKRTDSEIRADLKALCDSLAPELEAATGEKWEALPARYQPDEWTESGLVSHYPGARFRRTRDGYTLTIHPSHKWNALDRAEAGIEWPDDPTRKGYAGRTVYREAPGVPYGSPEPKAGFSLPAKPAAVARRMVRDLIKPEHEAARLALLKRAADNATESEQAAAWREKVGAAHGTKFAIQDWNGGGVAGPSKYSNWAGIEPKGRDRPGGVLTLDLPENPDRAAALVSAIRALVEAENAAPAPAK